MKCSKGMRRSLATITFLCAFTALQSGMVDSAGTASEGIGGVIRARRVNEIGIKKRLSHPASAVFGPGNRLYVLDGEDRYIKVYSTSGDFLFSFGGKTSGDGGLIDPLGLTITSEGEIYVADTGHGRIAVFGTDGSFLRDFALRPDRYNFPADPTDLYVDEKLGRCFITDNNNHRVIVYENRGAYVGEWGQVGFDNGEFRYPFRVAGSPGGELFISDVVNTRVQAFSLDGKYLYSLGEWGVELGRHFRPNGVAVDVGGRIFVSDGYLGVIQVFQPGGEIFGLLADEKGDRLVFESPTHLDISPEGLLAVTECYADKVSIYKIEN